MKIYLFNSLTGKKELFVPLNKGYAGIYCCGPTVYSDSHLGHARSAITYDILVRLLRYVHYKVRYVKNITDVGHLTDDSDTGEDKVIKQAKLQKLEPMELVEKYLKKYNDHMNALNVLHPNIAPRASAHIPEQIEAIKKLINTNHAYTAGGSVYFDIQTFKDYGKLSKRVLKDQKYGVRIKVIEEKRHPGDFALWKKADPDHILKWNSPWGYGYPGWHIECSVMANKYLGDTIDMHGGGMDLQFPHHECEIAQSESLTGKTFVNYWVHNNMITVDGLKMSKSLGNYTTIEEILTRYEAMTIRYFILSSHYRSTLDFNEDALRNAKKTWDKILALVLKIKDSLKTKKSGNKPAVIDNKCKEKLDRFKYTFLTKIADDMNTPEALAEFFIFLSSNKEIFDYLHNLNKATLTYFDSIFSDVFETVLGFKFTYEPNKTNNKNTEVIKEIKKLRNNLRKKGLYDEADELRKILLIMGESIRDLKITQT